MGIRTVFAEKGAEINLRLQPLAAGITEAFVEQPGARFGEQLVFHIGKDWLGLLLPIENKIIIRKQAFSIYSFFVLTTSLKFL